MKPSLSLKDKAAAKNRAQAAAKNNEPKEVTLLVYSTPIHFKVTPAPAAAPEKATAK